MSRKRYDVFVSYRRTSFETANLIATKLQMVGYSVFLDVETLNSGKFNERLLQVIDGCKDVILVLPPNALDRCSDENDWVRMEVEYALSRGKNIIPIMLAGFEWPAADTLPLSLRELPNYNAISATDPNLFIENMERLKRSFLKSRPASIWRKYRIVICALVAIALGVVGYISFVNSPTKPSKSDNGAAVQNTTSDDILYKHRCAKYASMLLDEYLLCDYNLRILNDAQDGWLQFLRDYRRDNPEASIAQLEALIDECRAALQLPNNIIVADEDVAILANGGANPIDIEAYNDMRVGFYNEINTHFDNILYLAQSGSPRTYSGYLSYGCTLNRYYLENLYYHLLYIFSSMPESVYGDIGFASVMLNYPTDVEVGLSAEEYKQLSIEVYKKYFETMQDMYAEMQSIALNTAADEEHEKYVESVTSTYNAIHAELQSAIKMSISDDDNEVSARKKIDYYTSTLHNYEKHSRTYIDMLGVEVGDVSELKKSMDAVIVDCYDIRENLIQAYESRWGEYN